LASTIWEEEEEEEEEDMDPLDSFEAPSRDVLISCCRIERTISYLISFSNNAMVLNICYV
jgi:hypothetical protein